MNRERGEEFKDFHGKHSEVLVSLLEARRGLQAEGRQVCSRLFEISNCHRHDDERHQGVGAATVHKQEFDGLTEMQIMNRTELKKYWNRSKTDRTFRRLLLAMLCALGAVPSKASDQLAACALADYTLTKAGAGGRRELRRILKKYGWEF